MTTWDKIYKEFQKGGDAWATLSEDIHPLFLKFLGAVDFKERYVFDIGCGDGKYLKFLQKLGFKTDGIDSSETSIAMTKKMLEGEADIQLANMFDYHIEKNKYDLIISLSTIHHGTKEQVQHLIDNVRDALVDPGRIFITVPDFANIKKWNTFKEHEEVSPGTFVPMSGPEKGLPHSMYTDEEVQALFAAFSNVTMELDGIGRWIIQAAK